MKALHIAAKDLSQTLRDRKSFLFLLAMPIAFTLFMGFAYGGQGKGKGKESVLVLAVLDHDGGGVATRRLLAELESSGGIKLRRLDEATSRADAETLVAKGAAAGALIVPPRWSESLLADSGAKTGSVPRLELIADPASPVGQTLFQVLRESLVRRLSSARAAVLVADPALRPAAFDRAEGLWSELEGQPSPIREEAVTRLDRGKPMGPYDQSSPGMIVMFSVFGLVNSAGLLVQERRTGSLRRLQATAAGRATILGGHLLAMFVITLGQTLVLLAFGQLALRVGYARVPLGILLVASALSLCMASAGLLIGAIAKGQDQVTLISLVSMFVLSALGGAWFPLEGAGRAFSAIGHLTPTAWAMTGFQDILVRGKGFESSLLPAAALTAFSLLFFGMAAGAMARVSSQT